MKTLYKKDSKDRIRFWTIRTEGAEIIQESGIVGTDSPVVNTKTAKAKNVGRSNETSPSEQAVSEMESAITKKLDKAYFETEEDAINEVVILPMLAKDYKKQKNKVDWNNCYGQPKLDGMRCSAIIENSNVTFVSRQGKEITTLEHLKPKLSELDDCVLDGELYAHGLSFQENMKIIKKYRKGRTENVKYHTYDIMITDKPFIERYQILCDVVAGFDSVVETVYTKKITSEEELKRLHESFVSQGYEGTIVRHGNDGYKLNGRSDSLLKYKDFIDIAIPLYDVIPAEQRPEWGNPIFEWDGATGHPMGDGILGAGSRLSHDERKDLLSNKEKYIGKTAEVRFFEYSDEGVPRFPVLVGFRLDK